MVNNCDNTKFPRLRSTKHYPQYCCLGEHQILPSAFSEATKRANWAFWQHEEKKYFTKFKGGFCFLDYEVISNKNFYLFCEQAIHKRLLVHLHECSTPSSVKNSIICTCASFSFMTYLSYKCLKGQQTWQYKVQGGRSTMLLLEGTSSITFGLFLGGWQNKLCLWTIFRKQIENMSRLFSAFWIKI